METETLTRPCTVVTDCRVVQTPTSRGPVALHLTRDELQQLVQAAYDRHGIVAEPSYDAEADRQVRRRQSIEQCRHAAANAQQAARAQASFDALADPLPAGERTVCPACLHNDGHAEDCPRAGDPRGRA